MISLKRLWFRLRSKSVWPEKVKPGDQLMFDYPGTGPYWTAPVAGVRYSNQRLSWIITGPMVWIWFKEVNSAMGVDTRSQAKVRVRR